MQPIEIVIGRPTPIPLLRKAVRAGFPSPADDFVEEEIDLQRLLIANRPATFMVRVDGDSVIEKGLRDKDLAVVDRSLAPRDGDVVVVDVDNERSFKVWAVRGGRPTLSFANRTFRPYELPRDAVVEVWGVVTFSISSHRHAIRRAAA